MEYLKEVGPDTMIPCFSVNLKGNNKVELCNAINSALFNDLCHSSSEQTAHRIPLLVTSSSMVPHKHSNAVPNLKKRLGVSMILACSYQDQIAQQKNSGLELGRLLHTSWSRCFVLRNTIGWFWLLDSSNFYVCLYSWASLFHKSVMIDHSTLSEQHSGPLNT